MRESIDAFLAQQAIAVVGVSRTRGFANGALRALRSKGYRAYPVNARADSVEGERCYRRLDDLPERVGAALVVVPPQDGASVVADCARLGIRHVWLQQGASSDDALAFGRAHGLDLVHDRCILMYASPRGAHRLHRWVRELRGRL
ncbi:MAG TPA: CoA-binding protein [Anaeromyxobacteraceae bacterium]